MSKRKRAAKLARESSYFKGPFPKDFVLTGEIARIAFSYDPLTGEIRWKQRLASTQRLTIGAVLGYRASTGTVIKVAGKNYIGGRLAWLIHTGEWPKEEVDRVDCDPNNNRLDNLRESTRQQNGANRGAHKNNRSGRKGVYLVTGRTNRWYSQLTVSGKRSTLGVFDCPAAAQLSYVVAADKAFGEFARAF